MNVTLPNGQVIENVPEGTTKAQLAAKLKANGMEVPQEWMGPKYISASDDPEQVGLMKALESIDKGIYDAGGAVTDFASKLGASSKVAGGLGYLTNVGLNVAPTFIGGGAAKPLVEPVKHAGHWLMQTSVKPILKDQLSGRAAKAIDTMLEKGINASEGGMEKLRMMIDDLNQQIATTIQNSKETIKIDEVRKALIDKWHDFKYQVDASDDLAAIEKSWDSFKNNPVVAGKTEISIQDAQRMKQGTNARISDKYGQLSSADYEAQKTSVRALKEQIAAKEPSVSALNAQDSELMNALSVTERKVLMNLNKDPMALTALAQNPAKFLAMQFDRSALFKSILARMIHGNAEPIAATIGRTGASAPAITNALSQ